MKLFSTFIIILFSINTCGQHYFPKLEDFWFLKENGILASTDYNCFVKEVKRIAKDIYCKDFRFSTSARSSKKYGGFYSMEIIALRDSIENVFKSSITAIFVNKDLSKYRGSDITYSEDSNLDEKILNAHLSINSGGLNLLIPEKLIRKRLFNYAQFTFNITDIDFIVADSTLEITLNGTSSKLIKFKRSKPQLVNKLTFKCTSSKVTLEVSYIDKKEISQTKILFEKDCQ